MTSLQSLWDMVNSAETRDDVADAEAVLMKSDIGIDEFDSLMSALAYISRECYSRNRR